MSTAFDPFIRNPVLHAVRMLRGYLVLHQQYDVMGFRPNEYHPYASADDVHADMWNFMAKSGISDQDTRDAARLIKNEHF